MGYTTYWSILDTPMYTFRSNFIFLAIALIGGISWYLVKKMVRKDNEERVILLWGTGAVFLFGIFLCLFLTFIRPDNMDVEMANKLNSNEFKKVEGVISGFNRKINRGKYGTMTYESFTVDGVNFSYNDGPLDQFGLFTDTYNNYIYDGQLARVTYRETVENYLNCKTILVIEIKE